MSEIKNAGILIVDDEKEITDLLELYLKNEGYKVYKFYEAKDVIKCVEENEIDLAILDVEKLGFKTAVVPKSNEKSLSKDLKIKLVGVNKITDALKECCF